MTANIPYSIKLLLFCLCASLACFFRSPAYGDDLSPMTLAYVDFPPYEYEYKGEPRGILVEIVNTVFQRAGIQLELIHYPFQRAYEETRKGSIDGLFNFYKTPERLKDFDYSDPIIDNPLVLFVHKDSEFEFSGNIHDLAGLRVGAIHGYTYGQEFDQSELFIIDYANSHEANFQKLILGRIDVYPCDKLVGKYILDKEDLHGQIKYLPHPLITMQGHIGFTRGRHNQAIKRINKHILEMHIQNEIQEIITNYVSR